MRDNLPLAESVADLGITVPLLHAGGNQVRS
jgi:hypothetical protein